MSLKSRWPSVYRQLLQAGEIAGRHLHDVAEIEFTVQNGQLFVNQMRKGTMPSLAHLRVQLRMLIEGLITPEEFLERIQPADVGAFLRPEIADKSRLGSLGKGLPSGGGAASGKIAFSPLAASRLRSSRTPSLLVVRDWGGETLRATEASVGVLATTGGISSHAALMCRQIGKPCVVNFRQGKLSCNEQLLRVPGFASLREGDWLTIDGMTGEVYAGQAQVETKPWKSHPELQQLSLIVEQAAASGHVPPKCAGAIWQIWDFMRHGLPLPGNESERRKGKTGQQDYPPTAARDLAAARRTVVQIDQAVRPNYSQIVLGLMATLDRLLRSAAGKPQPFCRALWDLSRQIQPRDSSQMVGFEFHGVNRRIPHLIEISDVRFLLECGVQSPAEAWAVERDPRFAMRVVPKSRMIKACQILVNGAQLDHDDIPKFYTWLRRREYFWRWFEEHQTSHQEITAFLKHFAKRRASDPKLSPLCWELGLFKQGRLTAAGCSLAALKTRDFGADDSEV